jgi:hypothetical protein
VLCRWEGQADKQSKWASALNDRFSSALKKIQDKHREEKDLSEAQKALEAVAKSHGKLTSQVNEKDEKNRALQRTIEKLEQRIVEQENEIAANKAAADDTAFDFEIQVKGLLGQIDELQSTITLLESKLQTTEVCFGCVVVLGAGRLTFVPCGRVGASRKPALSRRCTRASARRCSGRICAWRR